MADLNQSGRLKRVLERPSSKIFLGEDVLERNLDSFFLHVSNLVKPKSKVTQEGAYGFSEADGSAYIYQHKKWTLKMAAHGRQY